MTSSIDKVTCLQVVTLLAVLTTTSISLTIPSNQQDIPSVSSVANTFLRNDTTIGISSENSTSVGEFKRRLSLSLPPSSLSSPPSSLSSPTSSQSSPTSSLSATTATIPAAHEEQTSRQLRTTTATNTRSIFHQIGSTTRTTTNDRHLQTTTADDNEFTTSSIYTMPAFQQLERIISQQQQQQQRQRHNNDSFYRQTIDQLQNIGSYNPANDTPIHIDLQENDIKEKVIEVFVNLTKGVQLSPGFMSSLVFDLIVEFKRTNKKVNDENVFTHHEGEMKADENGVGVVDDGGGGGGDNDDDDYGGGGSGGGDDNYTEFGYQDEIELLNHISKDDSEISNEKNGDLTNEIESESDNNVENSIDFEFDIHQKFNGFLTDLINKFSKQNDVTDEGHKMFLDLLLEILRLYFHQSSTRSEFHYDQSDHNHYHQDHEETTGYRNSIIFKKLKENATQQFIHLVDVINNNHTKHKSSQTQIPELGIYEDFHILLTRVINVIETGDAEVNQCISKCIGDWQHRKKLLNQKPSVASEMFMKNRNITGKDWDKRLVEMRLNQTNKVRECKYPTPENHNINQYRYMLPGNHVNPENGFHSSITGGKRLGDMIPDHVMLYRCRYRYGCCNHYDDHPQVMRKCAAKNWTIVEKVYEESVVQVIDEEEVTSKIPRLYKFINETACHCKVFSKNNNHCTNSFEFVDDDVNNLVCGCNRRSTTYSLCTTIMKGLRKLSDSDLRCIRLRKCLIPTCTHGEFDFSRGACPPHRLTTQSLSSETEPT